MTHQVAVVGAGAAGAAAATVLADDVDVRVFEKESRVGGRSRTHERGDCRYEVGANYLTPADEDVVALIETDVFEDCLLELDDTIRHFDGDGTVGASGNTGSRHLTCTDGLAQVPARLLKHVDVEPTLDTEVASLERGDNEWTIRDDTAEILGTFDAVVLTPPAPLAADLLGRSAWPHEDCRALREAIESVPYRPIASVVCHYPFELDVDWYALVNDDREHPLGWIAREECKLGHVPAGETVLLVQCSSDFTIDHYGADPDEIVQKASDLVAGLLGDERLAEPDWTDHHCWRYAVPEDGVDPERLDCATDHDLYVAGDWVVGEDRMNGALRSGLATGEAVRDDLV